MCVCVMTGGDLAHPQLHEERASAVEHALSAGRFGPGVEWGGGGHVVKREEGNVGGVLSVCM